jgi:hypothetical protein
MRLWSPEGRRLDAEEERNKVLTSVAKLAREAFPSLSQSIRPEEICLLQICRV